MTGGLRQAAASMKMHKGDLHPWHVPAAAKSLLQLSLQAFLMQKHCLAVL